MPSVKFETTVEIQDCISCGGPIALTQLQLRTLRTSHELFYCPVGHRQNYTGKTDTERLKEAQDTISVLETSQTNLKGLLEATEGKVAEYKKAAKKGQCPHCNQYFADLHRHVRRQHDS